MTILIKRIAGGFLYLCLNSSSSFSLWRAISSRFLSRGSFLGGCTLSWQIINVFRTQKIIKKCFTIKSGFKVLIEPWDLVSVTFNESTDLISSAISPNLSGDSGFHSTFRSNCTKSRLNQTNRSMTSSRKPVTC